MVVVVVVGVTAAKRRQRPHRRVHDHSTTWAEDGRVMLVTHTEQDTVRPCGIPPLSRVCIITIRADVVLVCGRKVNWGLLEAVKDLPVPHPTPQLVMIVH
jgi:hypothetical protein